ncbi:MAG: AbrB family transcriptional regulator [Spirochaetales bacterium]|nr:AbrB family transcriptional regulator [Spirochaetales bacterium]
MINLLITVSTGWAGGFIASRVRVPAGWLTGSLCATALLHLLWPPACLPPELKAVTQILAGSFLGAGFRKQDILAMKGIIRPALLLIPLMMLMNLIIGWGIHLCSGIDIATSLLASAPGGITEMSLVAISLGGDPGLVAFVQLLRFMTVMGISPIFLSLACRGKGAATSRQPVPSHSGEASQQTEFLPALDRTDSGSTDKTPAAGDKVLTLAISLVFGFIGTLVPIPAAPLTFSMMACAVFTVMTGRGRVFTRQRMVTQVLAGTLIGSAFQLHTGITIQGLAAAVTVLVLGVVALNLLMGYLIHRIGGMDLPTALFSSTPGGLSDMALLSGEFGADQSRVILMQLLRLFSVIAFFPGLIRAFVSLL